MLGFETISIGLLSDIARLGDYPGPDASANFLARTLVRQGWECVDIRLYDDAYNEIGIGQRGSPLFVCEPVMPAVQRDFIASLDADERGGVVRLRWERDLLLAPFISPWARDQVLYFVPLRTSKAVLGLVTLASPSGNHLLAPEGLRMLRTAMDLAATHFENESHLLRAQREATRSATLARIGTTLRSTLDRQEMFAHLASDARIAFGAARCVIFAEENRRSGTARMLAVADPGIIATPIPETMRIAGSWSARCLADVQIIVVEALQNRPEDQVLDVLGVAAAIMVPFLVDGRATVAMSLHYDRPRHFDELEIGMLRSIALHVELALVNARLFELESDRRRRVESLERSMLSLRDVRDPHEVLEIVARSLARETGRACSTFLLRDGAFRPVLASDAAVHRNVRLAEIDVARLRVGEIIDVPASDVDNWKGLIRPSGGELVPILADGDVRALVALEGVHGAAAADTERNYLRTLGAHAALALANARAFEQLRRYAVEGAALTEAARTFLCFTSVDSLAGALTNLTRKVIRSERVCVYVRRDAGLLRLGTCVESGIAMPDELPAGDGPAVYDAFAAACRPATALVVPIVLPDDPQGSGYVVVAREPGAPFDKAEIRLVEALVTLAALALRNVELYEAATRANRALGESNAFKDDLMAMFAHDFKGPLTVISGFCELLEETESDEVQNLVRTITEQTRRLAKLSEDAVALAATQSAGFSLQRERTDFGEFISSCIVGLDRGLGRLVFDGPDGEVFASFDRTRLRHVIDNVVGNALKYSSGDVNVRVHAGPQGEATLTVSDCGIGIPAADIERVFTRFGRAANARSRGIAGSGVGLYIAKKIVDVHGGSLVVASEEGHGSTFTMTLPNFV